MVNLLADKLQFSLYIVDQQRHIAVQIKLGHFEYKRIAQHRHSAHPVNLKNIHLYSTLFTIKYRYTKQKLPIRFFCIPCLCLVIPLDGWGDLSISI